MKFNNGGFQIFRFFTPDQRSMPMQRLGAKIAAPRHCTIIRQLDWGSYPSRRYLEGDFDHYVNQIRQPHIWGGEPELIMCCHVLMMPITVYMRTSKGSEGLKVIAEYGQEYGKEDPVRVLYHGYGHYDALQLPLSIAQPKLHMKR